MKSTNANFHYFSQNFLSNLSSMHFLLFSAQAQIHRYFRQGPWKMLDQDIGPCQKLPMVLVSRPLFFWPVVNWPYCWYFCSKTMRVFSVELLMWLFQLWHNAVSGDIILRWALWTGRSWEFKDMLKRVWYTRCLVGIDIIDAVCTSLILLTVCTVDTPSCWWWCAFFQIARVVVCLCIGFERTTANPNLCKTFLTPFKWKEWSTEHKTEPNQYQPGECETCDAWSNELKHRWWLMHVLELPSETLVSWRTILHL